MLFHLNFVFIYERMNISLSNDKHSSWITPQRNAKIHSDRRKNVTLIRDHSPFDGLVQQFNDHFKNFARDRCFCVYTVFTLFVMF